MKTNLELIIEKGEDKALWGRVTFDDNLIVDSASSVKELEKNIKALLKEFEDVDPETVEFTHLYDVYALFQQFNFLKISSIAKYAGLNASLVRQYASGIKNPGKEQAKKIETALHKLAAELQEAHIFTDSDFNYSVESHKIEFEPGIGLASDIDQEIYGQIERGNVQPNTNTSSGRKTKKGKK